MNTSDSEHRSIRWGRVFLCTIAGAIAIWMTLQYAGPSERRSVITSLLIEGSAALFLLALFYVVERGFTSRVTSVIARQVHDDVVAPLESRVDELAVNIADLQEAVEQRRSAQANRHHDLANQLGQPTFRSVTAALAEAARLNAINGGLITVQANEDPDGIWLQFGWGANFLERSKVGPDELRVRTRMPEQSGHRREVIAEMWTESESLLDVADRLNDRLRQIGVRDGRYSPNWTLAMDNLQRSLAVALPAHGNEWQLQGPLYELVGTDWAVTTAGIEHRNRGVVLSASEFPRSTFPPAAGTQLGDPPPWEPETPSGIDADEWRVVVDRGRARLTRRGYAIESGVSYGSPSIATWYPVGQQPTA